ncbi:MAG: alpha/beta hydrolase [Opitutaceae bacterium]|jgi:phospholipase/carboxylesterase|nr:alpha/beta hydrolase [Opitutaceae bacterium]
MKTYSENDYTLRFGAPLGRARAAVILVHGRGASAESIAGLAKLWAGADGLAFLAPQANGGSWYPQRFLAPLAANEPWLTAALGRVATLVAEAEAAGVPAERIGLAGFSQGACLVLEHAWRERRRYGFVAGLSGALIGPLDTPRERVGASLGGTPVLLGCAERDAHIPLDHVEHGARVLADVGAEVTKLIFPGEAHTVFAEEAEWLRARGLALLAGA